MAFKVKFKYRKLPLKSNYWINMQSIFQFFSNLAQISGNLSQKLLVNIRSEVWSCIMQFIDLMQNTKKTKSNILEKNNETNFSDEWRSCNSKLYNNGNAYICMLCNISNDLRIFESHLVRRCTYIIWSMRLARSRFILRQFSFHKLSVNSLLFVRTLL